MEALSPNAATEPPLKAGSLRPRSLPRKALASNASDTRVQGPLDVRQGDVHDRDVQQQHERAQAHRDQRPPLAPALITILAAGPGLPGRLPDVWRCGRHEISLG